jgi:hypothetical protein
MAVTVGTESFELTVAAPATDDWRFSMETTMNNTANKNNSEVPAQTRELNDHELELVAGGTYTKQRPDGTAAGNVVGGWDLIPNKVHA